MDKTDLIKKIRSIRSLPKENIERAVDRAMKRSCISVKCEPPEFNMDIENVEHLKIIKALGFKWMAMNASGVWVVYEYKPTLSKSKQAKKWWNSKCGNFIITKLKTNYTGDWRDSRINLRKL
jgi:hypothetical protein